MAHLWISFENQWQPVLLNGASFSLLQPTPEGLRPRVSGTALTDGVILQRRPNGLDGWLMLVPPLTSVWVNGYPVTLGARVLCDQDEIRLAGMPAAYFSTEELTVVEPFAGPQPVDCPRCSKSIEPGTLAARCPGCHISYHQLADRSCFTYAEACTTCGGETVLSEEFRWTPEML